MKFLTILIFSLILISSCSIDDPISDKGVPIIVNVNPTEIRVTDTIKIDGKHFGIPSQLNYILIDSLRIISTNCIKWQNNEIWFIVPDSAHSGKLRIVISADTSNSYDLNIIPIPAFDYVQIDPQNFLMGSLTGNNDEKPTEIITITKGFYITTTEISQRLYRVVMQANPSIEIGDFLPVYNVTWLDAVSFCNKLSKIENLDTAYRISGGDVLWDTTSNGWRLPTEAEWELSCRAGTNGDFYIDNLNDIAWYSDNSGYRVKPIASKLPNKYGLYDMSGNVWEWCYDYYNEFYYGNRQTTNPKGPKTGKRRVIRGGAFDQGTYFARSSNRTQPNETNGNIGFRIVRNKNN